MFAYVSARVYLEGPKQFKQCTMIDHETQLPSMSHAGSETANQTHTSSSTLHILLQSLFTKRLLTCNHC